MDMGLSIENPPAPPHTLPNLSGSMSKGKGALEPDHSMDKRAPESDCYWLFHVPGACLRFPYQLKQGGKILPTPSLDAMGTENIREALTKNEMG